MTEARKPRPVLSIARAPRRPSLALVKKALRLFAGKYVSREVRHANARKWLRAMAQLGDKHTLHLSKPKVRWGQPGDPVVHQVFAPRRLGGA